MKLLALMILLSTVPVSAFAETRMIVDCMIYSGGSVRVVAEIRHEEIEANWDPQGVELTGAAVLPDRSVVRLQSYIAPNTPSLSPQQVKKTLTMTTPQSSWVGINQLTHTASIAVNSTKSAQGTGVLTFEGINYPLVYCK